MVRFLLGLGILLLAGCYSFKGIVIPEGVNTFTVQVFENTSENVEPTLGQTLAENLKNKVLSNSRLSYEQENGDAEFSGTITSYQVIPIDPKPGDTRALNRLEMKILVDYVCRKDEKLNWAKNITKNTEYDSSQDFSSIQDRLIEDLSEQLIEDIFDRAFTAW